MLNYLKYVSTIKINKELSEKFKSGICSECEQPVTVDYVSNKKKGWIPVVYRMLVGKIIVMLLPCRGCWFDGKNIL